MYYLKPSTFLALFLSLTMFSQSTDSKDDKLSLTSGTLDNQFEYVIQKSNSWTNESGLTFQVIRTSWLSDLKKNALDSLQVIKKDLNSSNITIKAQSKEIEDLKISVTNIQNSLNETKGEKDNISLLGAQMSKGSYSSIMWSIVGILLAALLFFIYRFNNSNVVTKHAKQVLLDLEDEFEEHRKTAVEREQKIRRQLLDEINKQKIVKPKK